MALYLTPVLVGSTLTSAFLYRWPLHSSDARPVNARGVTAHRAGNLDPANATATSDLRSRWRSTLPAKASLLPPQEKRFAGRKVLVLDLDETLVHSSFKPMPTFGSYIFNFMSKPEPDSDFILNIEVGSAAFKVQSRKRPGVDEFLERVSKHYEVIVFTASLPQYANPLLDLLDPKGHITGRLFRHHCMFQEGYFIKDLTRLRNNQNLMNTIIVDNSPIAYKFQPENAIDCTTWLGDPLDVELHLIADFLETIKDVNDVREYVEYWREGAEVLNPRPAPR